MSRRRPVQRAAGLLATLLIVAGCTNAPPAPTPTPNYPLLETRIVAQLGATMTARAPAPTETPQPPTATPEPTSALAPAPPTPVDAPTAPPSSRQLAYVRIAANGIPSILLRDLASGEEAVLTHFAEPMGISDLTWSHDGQWLSFVSSLDLMHSRDNEWNVFLVRGDGTDLHMLTGDYVDPKKAPGPYVVLLGQVTGATAACRVSAQGAANSAQVGSDGSFELPGVPTTATWVRAICPGEAPLQGDATLLPVAGGFAPASIEVRAEGRGWRRASLSPGGATLAGLYYRWRMGTDAKPAYTFEGVLTDIETSTWYTLTIPEGSTFQGLDWSPKGGVLVAALAGEKSTALWRYGPDGKPVALIVEIPNPEQEILTAVGPAWSPDGSQIAFELRHWYWWGQSRYKTEIMVVSAAGEGLRSLVTTDWGTDAVFPSWAYDGQAIYYQLSVGAPKADFQSKTSGDLYVISLDGEALALTKDGRSYYPTARPAK